jgi:hypothetical protein
MAERNPSTQPFHVTKVDLRSVAESLVDGRAYDLGRGRSLAAFLPYERGRDQPIDHREVQ